MTGARLLVLEDEFILRLDLQDELERMGYRVVSNVASCAEALAVIHGGQPLDAAILDVQLANREHSYLVAECLEARGVPYVFTTGHHRSAIDPRFSHVPVLQKPFDPERLAATLESLLRGGAGTTPYSR